MAHIQTINATEFKAKCLDILDRLGTAELDEVVITKRGKTVAVLRPPQTTAQAVQSLHGFMRGSVTVADGFDLTAPMDDVAFEAEAGTLHG